MNSFDVAINYVLANECDSEDMDKVSSNPNDLGGTTKYGISLRFMRSLSAEKLKTYGVFVHGEAVEQDIIDLSLESAKAIYQGEFWDHAPFFKINTQASVNYIFDCAVNLGISPAIKIAQRACWSVMHTHGLLADDGILGNETLDQINQSGTYLVIAMRSERASYYRMIVEHNASQIDFLPGWLNRAYKA
jgi:lysozyme family protein